MITELTPEQYAAIVKAAREREGQTTPAPWKPVAQQNSQANGKPEYLASVGNGLPVSAHAYDFDDAWLEFGSDADAALITTAPDVQSALLYADARIKALEAELAQLKRCPVCDGDGWYGRQISENEQVQEQCETCYGTGVRHD